MTEMQKLIFHRPFSSQANQTASVYGYTLCPRLDGPSDRVNETKIQFDTAIVGLNIIVEDSVFFFTFASYNSVFV